MNEQINDLYGNFGNGEADATTAKQAGLGF